MDIYITLYFTFKYNVLRNTWFILVDLKFYEWKRESAKILHYTQGVQRKEQEVQDYGRF